MKRTLALAAAVAVTLSACGGDGGTGPDGGGGSGNSMAATVGGQPFSPPKLTVVGTYNAGAGLFNVTGSHTTNGVTTQVSINLMNVNGPGTYTLSPNFAGQFGQVTQVQGIGSSLSSWSTVLAPGNGEVELTTFTSERAVGTFHFVGQAAPNTNASGQMNVTSGSFDVKF